MTLSVDVAVAQVDGLLLPTEVVQDALGTKPYVWAIEQERVAKRPVKLGVRGEGHVQVLSGVKEGEVVLVPQGKPVTVGGRVRPVTEQGRP